jgi:hypothetical protein
MRRTPFIFLLCLLPLLAACGSQSTRTSTPYEAASARYVRLMANRPTIQRKTVNCLPMWCRSVRGTPNAAALTARRNAARIEANQKILMVQRQKIQAESLKNKVKNQTGDSLAGLNQQNLTADQQQARAMLDQVQARQKATIGN